MKDGAIIANSGHFNVEIDIGALRAMATETREARQFVEEFTLADGRKVYLLADGRLVNLSAAEGHPASVMDMSFANQALSAEYIVEERRRARAQGLRRAEGDRRRDRAAQARDDGHLDRPADGGAGEVPGLVGRGHVGQPRAQAARRDLDRSGSSGSRTTPSSSSTSGGCPRRWSSSAAPTRRSSPRRSGHSPCAARRRSASPPRTGWRSRRREGATSTTPTRCSRRPGRRPSISAGRSTRCAPIRRPSAPGASTRTRSPAASRWAPMPPTIVPPAARILTHCNAGGLATGGYGSAVGAIRAAAERGGVVARVGRRDTAAAPGRPPDRVRARGARDPARGDRRLRGRARGWPPARSTS